RRAVAAARGPADGVNAVRVDLLDVEPGPVGVAPHLHDLVLAPRVAAGAGPVPDDIVCEEVLDRRIRPGLECPAESLDVRMFSHLVSFQLAQTYPPTIPHA